jgi:site-specific recombinase XerD
VGGVFGLVFRDVSALSFERPVRTSKFPVLSSVREVSPMTSLRQRMLEDLRIRNYAPSTVTCYVRAVAQFAKHFNQSPDHLGPDQIRSWQLYLLNVKGFKLPSYIQAISGLRFFYKTTLNSRIDIDRIPLPRYESKLPAILSKEEVKALLEAPKNLGHRAILATMYGAGLRVSEVAYLQVSDIDGDRKVITIRGGKGRKDRQVMLPHTLREVLAAYWRWKRPTEWFFSGGKPDSPISQKVWPAARPRELPVSPSRFIPIHCATPSPRICLKTAPICWSFRLCRVTRA